MKQKTFAVVLMALTALAASSFGRAAPSTSQVTSKTDGLHIGTKAADKLGFYDNATAIAQPAATSTAYGAMKALGLIATGSADYSVQHLTVALTAANLIAMYAAPVQIIPAPGAGKTILITRLAFKITYTTTDFTGGGAVIFQYDSTANGAGTQALDSTLAATLITHSGGAAVATAISARNGAVLSSVVSTTLQNKGIYISNATAVFAAGTGTAVVDVWYVVQ